MIGEDTIHCTGRFEKTAHDTGTLIQEAEFYREENRPVCFVFERARAPWLYLLGKGHPMRKL